MIARWRHTGAAYYGKHPPGMRPWCLYRVDDASEHLLVWAQTEADARKVARGVWRIGGIVAYLLAPVDGVRPMVSRAHIEMRPKVLRAFGFEVVP